ncbi:MAG: hypothetical protein ACRDBY_10170 [Cetobacterium sp.]
MKKLLLLSLLAMGATSFATVEGTADRAEMPITVRGTVIAKTGTNLIIEPIKNAGVAGASIEFDFGAVVQGQKQSLDGTFAIYKANSSEIVTDANKDKLAVGLLNTAKTDVEATQTTNDVGGITGLTATYTVSSTPNPTRTRVEGNIAVNIDATTVDGAGAGNVGSFLDTTKKLAVIIKP